MRHILLAVAVGAVILTTVLLWPTSHDGDSQVTAAADTIPFQPRDEARPHPSSTTTTAPTPPTTVRRAAPQGQPRVAPGVTSPGAAPVQGAEAFRRCVATRESGNNYHVGFAGMYGILAATWHSLGHSGLAGNASPAEQDAAFWQLYAKYGKQPWSAYDGCR